jgi:hypothetical protein
MTIFCPHDKPSARHLSMTICRVDGVLVMYSPLHAVRYLILECQVAERPRSDQIKQFEFGVRYVGKDPIIKFSFDDKTHISLWSKVADDESWADEWARVCAYVVDLFQLSEMPKVELTYVDDDGDEITMLVPPTTNITLLKQGRRSSTRCWKLLMSFAMEDTSKCRKLHVTDTRKQTVQVLPSRNYKVQHKLKAVMHFIVDYEKK